MNVHSYNEFNQVQPAMRAGDGRPIYAFSRTCQARRHALRLAIMNGIHAANMACFHDNDSGDSGGIRYGRHPA
jgi:hypothetical protein